VKADTRRVRLGRLSWWQRLHHRMMRRPKPELPSKPEDPQVDTRLLAQVELAQVRSFVEGIESYRLHSQRVVHVVSNYRMPTNPNLAAQVPWWFARRLRFGVAEADGSHRYVPIIGIELVWNELTTELFLRMEESVAAGTSAFVAAYLGEGAAPESRVIDEARSEDG
jgi:hypothetical protein